LNVFGKFWKASLAWWMVFKLLFQDNLGFRPLWAAFENFSSTLMRLSGHPCLTFANER